MKTKFFNDSSQPKKTHSEERNTTTFVGQFEGFAVARARDRKHALLRSRTRARPRKPSNIKRLPEEFERQALARPAADGRLVGASTPVGRQRCTAAGWSHRRAKRGRRSPQLGGTFVFQSREGGQGKQTHTRGARFKSEKQ